MSHATATATRIFADLTPAERRQRQEDLAETLVLTKIESKWGLPAHFPQAGGLQLYPGDHAAFTAEFVRTAEMAGGRARYDFVAFPTFYAALIALYQFKDLDDITEAYYGEV